VPPHDVEPDATHWLPTQAWPAGQHTPLQSCAGEQHLRAAGARRGVARSGAPCRRVGARARGHEAAGAKRRPPAPPTAERTRPLFGAGPFGCKALDPGRGRAHTPPMHCWLPLQQFVPPQMRAGSQQPPPGSRPPALQHVPGGGGRGGAGASRGCANATDRAGARVRCQGRVPTRRWEREAEPLAMGLPPGARDCDPAGPAAGSGARTGHGVAARAGAAAHGRVGRSAQACVGAAARGGGGGGAAEAGRWACAGRLRRPCCLQRVAAPPTPPSIDAPFPTKARRSGGAAAAAADLRRPAARPFQAERPVLACGADACKGEPSGAARAALRRRARNAPLLKRPPSRLTALLAALLRH
jgi:hypothetical protein